MWTEEHRTRHAARLKQMVAVHADEEMARGLARADAPRSRTATPLVAVVRAIAWPLRVGGPWRALPSDMPPGTASPFFPPGDRLRRWRTVYGWFRRWLGLGLVDARLIEIARVRRRAAERRAMPRLAIIDTQTLECIAVRGSRGDDAGTQGPGRKRVALVDANGQLVGCSGGSRRGAGPRHAAGPEPGAERRAEPATGYP